MAHTVLIVEDDPNIADLLHLYLEKDGYVTETHRTAARRWKNSVSFNRIWCCWT